MLQRHINIVRIEGVSGLDRSLRSILLYNVLCMRAYVHACMKSVWSKILKAHSKYLFLYILLRSVEAAVLLLLLSVTRLYTSICLIHHTPDTRSTIHSNA